MTAIQGDPEVGVVAAIAGTVPTEGIAEKTDVDVPAETVAGPRIAEEAIEQTAATVIEVVIE